MLNGDGNEMASRSVHLISKKIQTILQHTFFLISKKTNLHLKHAFLSFFAVVLHDYNPVLYDQGAVYMEGGRS